MLGPLIRGSPVSQIEARYTWCGSPGFAYASFSKKYYGTTLVLFQVKYGSFEKTGDLK